MKKRAAEYLLLPLFLSCLVFGLCDAVISVKAASRDKGRYAEEKPVQSGENQELEVYTEDKSEQETISGEEFSKQDKKELNKDAKGTKERPVSACTAGQNKETLDYGILEIRAESSTVEKADLLDASSQSILFGKDENSILKTMIEDPFTFKVYANVKSKDKVRVELKTWTDPEQEEVFSTAHTSAKNQVHINSFELKLSETASLYQTEIPYQGLGVYSSRNGTIHYQVFVRNEEGQEILSSEPMAAQAYGGYMDGKYQGHSIESFLRNKIHAGALDVYGSCAISSNLQITDYIHIHGDSTLWLETQNYEPSLYLKGNTSIRGDGRDSKIILSKSLKIKPKAGAIAVESGTAGISDLSFSSEDDYIEGISGESHGIWSGGSTTLNITGCHMSSPSTGSIVGTYGNLNVKGCVFDKGNQGIHFNGAYNNQEVRSANCSYRNLAQGIQGGTPDGKKEMSLYLEGINDFSDIAEHAVNISDGAYLSFDVSSSTEMYRVGSGVQVSGFTKAAIRNMKMNGTAMQSGVGILFHNTPGETFAVAIENFKTGLETRNGSSVKGTATNIKGNAIGVLNDAAYEHKSGSISNNHEQGVCHKGSAFWFTGGSIIGNGNCDVYLETGRVIDWKKFGNPNGEITRILSRSTKPGTTLVRNQFQENGDTAAGEAGENYFAAAHGGRIIGRGGNRNGGERTHLVLSGYYYVTYDKNSRHDIFDMPQNQIKYWREDFIIPEVKPVNMTYSFIKFQGWDLDKDNQPDIGPAGILKMNQDIHVRAVWEDKIYIDYQSNDGDNTSKTEFVSSETLESSGRLYTVKKNTGYTDYAREGYTYAGFDMKHDVSPLQVSYKEGRDNKISLSDMQQNIMEVNGEARLVLYAVWDKKPEISFHGINEFYEGTDVDSEKLKDNVTVWDEEEGDLTQKLQIMQIQYADGRLTDGKPEKGNTVSFPEGMGEQDKLDTWFMALDKDKSPVTHKIVYKAADSQGGITRSFSNVLVKYNEFPAIEALDRYFTIEEANSGAITQDSLLRQALASEKIKVSDKEEDAVDLEYMKKHITIENFVPDEFTRITTDTMILLELAAKDGMGPGGEGKETKQSLKVYVKQPGEIPKKPENSRVRFFDQKNYKKNEGKADPGLTEEEKEEYNQNGGFHVDSLWYTNPQYMSVIKRCFVPGIQPMAVYSFPHGKSLEAKKFIEINGIGNAQNENALAEFTAKFMSK